MLLDRKDGKGSAPEIVLGGRVPGSIEARIEEIAGKPVMFISSTPSPHKGALTEEDGHKMAAAVRKATQLELPIVLLLSTSGASIHGGIASLHGWGAAAAAIASASGVVPIIAGLHGPAVSGPALLLGLADVVITTPDAFAFVSGPDMVRGFTGVDVDAADLGGSYALATRSGVSFLEASDLEEILEQVEEILALLPRSTNQLPPFVASEDPADRECAALEEIVPTSATGSYDVREVIGEIVDDAYFLELRAAWAPQLVVGLARIAGNTVGILANQPRVLAGTLDIPAAQKGGRFVRFCDAFNIPLITLEDTPGFLPGKDVEWRGMIRHGAEMAFAYASCGVPRICLIMRKAYGGAYIVMDSKGMGSDVVFAWPKAEIAVMGAQGAAQILMRRSTPDERKSYEEEYQERYLTPYVAAERGFVDDVIEPVKTRQAVAQALEMLLSKKERIRNAKHANSPM
ncbi:MAG: hypothetical protein M0Z34_01650 [Nitrospiraceae bacterium]|nr:hypothetical protein [Nitrospiraceae bacterium]